MCISDKENVAYLNLIGFNWLITVGKNSLKYIFFVFQVKEDLLKMMDCGLIQSCREGTFKIGLF